MHAQNLIIGIVGVAFSLLLQVLGNKAKIKELYKQYPSQAVHFHYLTL